MALATLVNLVSRTAACAAYFTPSTLPTAVLAIGAAAAALACVVAFGAAEVLARALLVLALQLLVWR